MEKFGSTSHWQGFVVTQVPDILSMVLSTWEKFPSPFSDELEDPVTNRFCVALKRARDRCDLPFRIDVQLVELDLDAGEEQGRMDIVFSPPAPREDIYFCLECKRVNVVTAKGRRACYSEYVVHGMLRFVQGQYAQKVQNGAMVAYVLDGDCQRAIAGIEGNLTINATALRMAGSPVFATSVLFPSDHRVKETLHNRTFGTEQFKIHHLFLAVSPTSKFRDVS
tara:strand:- start:369 stop:1037 length:669 start_codon:yes stop_codon:yes gene_type:complete